MTFSPQIKAQALGQRTRFVFHVYVDPLHGDDARALSLNYGGKNPIGKLDSTKPLPIPVQQAYLALSKHLYHKNVANQPKVSDGYLQHAPYAFKTVGGAMKYIGQEFGAQKTVLGFSRWDTNLPWKKPYKEGSDPDLYIDYIVVHCLEGIYGKILNPNSNGEEIDTRSGLPYNGEDFPIYLPDRVCLQGTSALSTIFDAREQEIPIILAGDSIGVRNQITYEDCFIDSLTIRGARASATHGFPNGSGIHIFRESSVYLCISNCFITDNWVGISIDNDEDVPGYQHSPIIVNNTIAWNRVGIWSGNSVQAKIGYAIPRVFNNIMDAGDPYGHFGPGINSGNSAPFWGLDPSDLQIKSPGNKDFNAYEAALANSPKTPGFLPYWPATQPRTNNPSYIPLVDIQPYTHAGQASARGSLYINDIFRNSQTLDRSPHDFRLAPLVSQTTSPPSSTNKNPLVNKGYLSYPISFANNAAPISYAPGLPSPGSQSNGSRADYAALHSMDWDAEGMGNPRVAPRPGFSAGAYSDIDLGADEMGVTIMAGFINGTRTFSRNIPNGENGSQSAPLPIPDHTLVYFFNLPGTYQRPFYVKWSGQTYTWWSYVQIPGLTPNPAGRYTQGVSSSFRHSQVTLLSWEPFMKGQECDTSPHLIPDWHPFWAQHFSNLNTAKPADIFGANPWYHHNWDDGQNPPLLSAIDTDNKYIYYDPNIAITLEGTTTPPGAWAWTLTWGYIGPGPYGTFGPFGYAGNGNYTIPTTPGWGYGDPSPGPDMIPFSGWLGDRYCVQDLGAFTSPLSNMQTFLGINDELPAEKGSSKSSLLRVKGPRRPNTLESKQLESSLKLEMARRRRDYANKTYKKASRKK